MRHNITSKHLKYFCSLVCQKNIPTSEIGEKRNINNFPNNKYKLNDAILEMKKCFGGNL